MIYAPKIDTMFDVHGEVLIPVRVIAQIASSAFTDAERIILLYVVSGYIQCKKADGKWNTKVPPLDECDPMREPFKSAFNHLWDEGILLIKPDCQENEPGVVIDFKSMMDSPKLMKEV